MLRIDAHVHAFPDRLALAVRNHLNREGRLQAGPLVEDVAAGVEAAGFDAAWMLPYAHRAGVAVGVNEWSAAAGGRFPRLIAGATFHPDDEELPALVERALVELRLRVVKLHCSVGHFLPSDPRLQPLWETASDLAVPVLVHAGRRSPGETDAAELDELRPVLQRYGGLRLVLAHTGYPNGARALELMAEYPHLFADVTPVWDRPAQTGVPELTRFAGRFLFGSDAPNNPVDAAAQAARYEALGLDRAALDQLLGGAACSLVATDTTVRRKAFAYITHGDRLLVFGHPHHAGSGIQVPAGTVEMGERTEAAVLREAFEETGLSGLRLEALLGVQRRDMADFGLAQVHERYFYHLRCTEPPPETWRHVKQERSDGAGEQPLFEFSWAMLPGGMPPLIADHDAFLPQLLAGSRLTAPAEGARA